MLFKQNSFQGSSYKFFVERLYYRQLGDRMLRIHSNPAQRCQKDTQTIAGRKPLPETTRFNQGRARADCRTGLTGFGLSYGHLGELAGPDRRCRCLKPEGEPRLFMLEAKRKGKLDFLANGLSSCGAARGSVNPEKSAIVLRKIEAGPLFLDYNLFPSIDQITKLRKKALITSVSNIITCEILGRQSYLCW
jgi:hypothetical protein